MHLISVVQHEGRLLLLLILLFAPSRCRVFSTKVKYTGKEFQIIPDSASVFGIRQKPEYGGKEVQVIHQLVLPTDSRGNVVVPDSAFYESVIKEHDLKLPLPLPPLLKSRLEDSDKRKSNIAFTPFPHKLNRISEFTHSQALNSEFADSFKGKHEENLEFNMSTEHRFGSKLPNNPLPTHTQNQQVNNNPNHSSSDQYPPSKNIESFLDTIQLSNDWTPIGTDINLSDLKTTTEVAHKNKIYNTSPELKTYKKGDREKYHSYIGSPTTNAEGYTSSELLKGKYTTDTTTPRLGLAQMLQIHNLLHTSNYSRWVPPTDEKISSSSKFSYRKKSEIDSITPNNIKNNVDVFNKDKNNGKYYYDHLNEVSLNSPYMRNQKNRIDRLVPIGFHDRLAYARKWNLATKNKENDNIKEQNSKLNDCSELEDFIINKRKKILKNSSDSQPDFSKRFNSRTTLSSLIENLNRRNQFNKFNPIERYFNRIKSKYEYKSKKRNDSQTGIFDENNNSAVSSGFTHKTIHLHQTMPSKNTIDLSKISTVGETATFKFPKAIWKNIKNLKNRLDEKFNSSDSSLTDDEKKGRKTDELKYTNLISAGSLVQNESRSNRTNFIQTTTTKKPDATEYLERQNSQIRPNNDTQKICSHCQNQNEQSVINYQHSEINSRESLSDKTYGKTYSVDPLKKLDYQKKHSGRRYKRSLDFHRYHPNDNSEQKEKAFHQFVPSNEPSRQSRLFDGPLNVPLRWRFFTPSSMSENDQISAPRTYVPILSQHDEAEATTPYMLHLVENSGPLEASLSEVLINTEDEREGDTQREVTVLSRPFTQTSRRPATKDPDQFPKSSTNLNLDFLSSHSKKDDLPNQHVGSIKVLHSTIRPLQYGQRIADDKQHIIDAKEVHRTPNNHISFSPDQHVKIYDSSNHYPATTSPRNIFVNILTTQSPDASTSRFVSQKTPAISTIPRASQQKVRQTTKPSKKYSLKIKTKLSPKLRQNKSDIFSKFGSLFFANTNPKTRSTSNTPYRANPIVVGTERPSAAWGLTATSQTTSPNRFVSDVFIGGLSQREIGERVMTMVRAPQFSHQTPLVDRQYLLNKSF